MLDFNKVPTVAHLKEKYPTATVALWDMDGTLFDSEVIHMDTMLDIMGITPPLSPDHLRLKHECTGLTDDQVLKKLQSEGLLTQYTAEEFVAIKDQRFTKALQECDMSLILLPDVEKLFEELRAHDFKIALVTSSERYTTDLLMEKSGFLKYFEFTITKQDVTNPKPHPEPYLKAMERLGVSPEQAIIFEDSITGLAAAKAAGAERNQLL